MSISDRYWGTQVVQGKTLETASLLGQLGTTLADVAAVARFKRWTSVTVGHNADGYESLIAWDKE